MLRRQSQYATCCTNYHSPPPLPMLPSSTAGPARSSEGNSAPPPPSAHEITTIYLISLPSLNPTLHPAYRQVGTSLSKGRARSRWYLASSVITWGEGDALAAARGGDKDERMHQAIELFPLGHDHCHHVRYWVPGTRRLSGWGIGRSCSTRCQSLRQMAAGTASRIAMAQILASRLLA